MHIKQTAARDALRMALITSESKDSDYWCVARPLVENALKEAELEGFKQCLDHLGLTMENLSQKLQATPDER
jgi:hypothetical protein